MLVSIPVTVDPTDGSLGTNILETLPAYSSSETYIDGDLVQYVNADDNYPQSIYGVFNVDGSHRFVYYSAIAPQIPFDNKNYTKVTSNTQITYNFDVHGTFDTIAFGKIIGDSVTVKFYDGTDALIYQETDFALDCEIDERLTQVAITQIIYSPFDVSPNGASNGRVEIVVTGAYCEIGSIVAGLSVEAGFTQLAFTNKYKDLSPKEQDQWGNILYIEGAKLNIHSGTVSLPTDDYDRLNRLMLKLGANIVIINGNSLRNNLPANGKSRFNSVMMIGRITAFSLKTELDKKRMGDRATYTISVEEIV